MKAARLLLPAELFIALSHSFFAWFTLLRSTIALEPPITVDGKR
jgi:hypothetical protein